MTHVCLSRGETNCLRMPCPARQLDTWKLLWYHRCVSGTFMCARYSWISSVLSVTYTWPVTTQLRIHPDFCMEDHSARGRCPPGNECFSKRNSGSLSQARHTRCNAMLPQYTRKSTVPARKSAAEIPTERFVQTQKPVTLMYITTTQSKATMHD